MSPTVKMRTATAAAFAFALVITASLITALLGFSSSGLPTTIAIALTLSASVWGFIVNLLKAEEPKQYILNISQYRPLLLSFCLFVALVFIWGICRSIVEWAIEPNIHNFGSCGPYSDYPCGEQDLNSDRRYQATGLADKIAAAIFLIAPMSLVTRKVRTIFL